MTNPYPWNFTLEGFTSPGFTTLGGEGFTSPDYKTDPTVYLTGKDAQSEALSARLRDLSAMGLAGNDWRRDAYIPMEQNRLDILRALWNPPTNATYDFGPLLEMDTYGSFDPSIANVDWSSVYSPNYSFAEQDIPMIPDGGSPSPMERNMAMPRPNQIKKMAGPSTVPDKWLESDLASYFGSGGQVSAPQKAFKGKVSK